MNIIYVQRYLLSTLLSMQTLINNLQLASLLTKKLLALTLKYLMHMVNVWWMMIQEKCIKSTIYVAIYFSLALRKIGLQYNGL